MTYWNGTAWVTEETAPTAKPRRLARRLLGATIEAGLITAFIFGLIASSAFAAKGGHGGGGGGGGGTFTGPVMYADANGNGAPNYWDDITFNVSSSASHPMVGLRCWQGTNWVFDGYVGYWPDYQFEPFFRLGSQNWDSSQDASCTARLFYYNRRGGEVALANPLTFTVAP